MTKHKFKNSLGPDFSLTVVLKDIRKISKDKITALFDFLWETQQNCSKLIHFKDVKLPIIKEIFYTLINKNIKDKSKDTLYVDINEMVKLIFENVNESNMDTSTKLTERIIILDKYIKEEEIKISDRDEIEIKINITDEEDEDDEETNYSEKLEKIMSGKYKGNISIAHLLKILKDKLVSNEKETYKLLIETNNSLEREYFCNLWISSFTSQGYKNSKEYLKFIDPNHLPLIKEFKNILIILLPGFKINFFTEDPKDITSKIKYRIK